ncbi:ATP-dependent DNA ligase [Subtercola vilae]|uniref:ATP-dependent DNA ligase n=2 Tax=Microbacteriaceae TaxID=85023 RepID=A0A4T2BVG0_9MICO|nr:ATP-dependent DNA ligase [Subtercola vilae]MEA9985527.1 ATP-dependent DNA ligase [Subtercola sp. RTI3]TIH35149.1 ATP-dependent DNA ligase [Subtercola vilae]
MGKLIYGSPGTDIDFDDRVLAHLRVVIVTKLRRGESFTMQYASGLDSGAGHGSLWMHPSIPLQFRFYGSKEPSLNRAWIEALMLGASTTVGLQLLPEPDPQH